MSTPARVAEARLTLARRLTLLRQDAGSPRRGPHAASATAAALSFAAKPPGCAAATSAAWSASCTRRGTNSPTD